MGLINIDSKIANSNFFQQNMKHCIPIFHPLLIASVFMIFGVIFIPLGIGMITQANSLLLSAPIIHQNSNTTQMAKHIVKIPKSQINFQKPIGIMYQLENFHQNIRSYVASFNEKQLASKDFAAPIFQNKKKYVDQWCRRTSNQSLAVNYPCGLIYNTRVTDEYILGNGQRNFSLNNSIVRWSDRTQNLLFGPAFKKLPDWERTAEWMRPAPFATVSKVYGYINQKEVEQLRTQTANSVDNSIEIELYTTGYHAGFDFERVWRDFSKERKIFLFQVAGAGGKLETRAFGVMAATFGGISLAVTLGFVGIWVVMRKRETRAHKVVRGWMEE